MTEPKDNTVAMFEITYESKDKSGETIVTKKTVTLRINIFGTLYLEGKHAFDLTPGGLRLLKRVYRSGNLAWLKTPQTHYHIWHICICPRCRAYNTHVGGRVWDHSQASFNEHLRFVDPDNLGTFPTIEETKQ